VQTQSVPNVTIAGDDQISTLLRLRYACAIKFHSAPFLPAPSHLIFQGRGSIKSGDRGENHIMLEEEKDIAVWCWWGLYRKDTPKTNPHNRMEGETEIKNIEMK